MSENTSAQGVKIKELEEEIVYMRGRITDAEAAGQTGDVDIFKNDIVELEEEIEKVKRGF